MGAVIDRIAAALDRLKQIHALLPWCLAFVILLPLPLLAQNNYQIYLVNIICIMIILATGLNIVKGFCGQVTVGHVALYAIGAFTSAVLSTKFGMPFWVCLPLAVCAAALAGALVGVPSFRLEGAYLALATLGFAQAVEIYIRVTNYLGAASGIGGIRPPVFFGYTLRSYESYYYLVMPIMLLALYASFAILRSATGRAFMAVREDPLTAAATGVNVKRYKLIAFVLSAVYAGLAGSLFAHMLPGYVHPNNFTVIEMVTVLLMVVLGGIGNIWGGVIGAIIITIVADITRDYYFYQLLLFGLVIVGTVLFMPKGIGGIIDRYLVSRKFVAAREATAVQKRHEAASAAEVEEQG
ncbi:MAG: branched-chain amino acid ABC transporter permease [Hyphomicrobiaceae bacterium]